MGILLKARKVLKKSITTVVLFICFFHTSSIVQRFGDVHQTYIFNLLLNIKKNIGIITFLPYCAHTKLLFQQLDILPFKKLVVHSLGLQMHKYEHGKLPNALNMLFAMNSSVHNYNTRN